MVLNKLLGKKKTPKIVGKGPAEEPKDFENSGNVGKKFRRYYVEFPKTPGHPTFLLEDSLTIGSESPEAPIQEEGIAPSHCSINLNHDVISVVDHGSPEGTFVNKKRIAPGKMIILGAKDKLKAGKVEFAVVEREEAVEQVDTGVLEAPPVELPGPDEAEETPPDDLPEQSPIEEVQIEDQLEINQGDESHEVIEEREEKPAAKQAGFKVKNRGVTTEAANGFLRVLGLMCDSLIVAIIHSVASGNKAYDDFVVALPEQVLNLIKPIYNEFGVSATAKAVEALPALKNGWQFLASLYEPEYIVYVQLILMLAAFRLATPILFGATLGQCFAGIRGKGNFLLKRMLSPLRWLFGLVLAPFFWLFDFPTLFSKRSFKEIASFTHLETPSNIMAVVSLVIFIPFLSLAFLTAPVWKSLEAPSPIPFTPMNKVELGVFDPGSLGPYSSYFKAALPKKAAIILPSFRFSQKEGKKSLDPSFILGGEDKGLANLAKLKMIRRVSLVKLLDAFSRGNPLAELKYPQIAALVHDASNTSKHFKDSGFPEEALAKDIQKLMFWATAMFEVDPKKIFGFLKENGPFLGGFVEFRKALESAFGPGAKSYALKQIGNAIHIIGDFSFGNRVIKRLLPLNGKETRVYEISYKKGSESDITEQIELMVWNGQEDLPNQNDLVRFVDLLHSGADDDDKLLDIFQGVNQAYYNYGKNALLEDRQEFLRELMRSVQGSIEVLKNSKALGIPARAGNKLSQNLNDILKALRDKDLEYFGVSSVGANMGEHI